jgi:hypothetical protein
MKPQDEFDHLDRPEIPRDRFKDFKASTSKLLEYREAYFALATANPDAVAGLPHPDGDPRTFNPSQAMESLQKIGAELRGVPLMDLKT